MGGEFAGDETAPPQEDGITPGSNGDAQLAQVQPDVQHSSSGQGPVVQLHTAQSVREDTAEQSPLDLASSPAEFFDMGLLHEGEWNRETLFLDEPNPLAQYVGVLGQGQAPQEAPQDGEDWDVQDLQDFEDLSDFGLAQSD